MTPNGLQPFLMSGEQVRWEGRSRAGITLAPLDALLVPFSLVWGGFAFYWNVTAWTTDAPLEFKLFGIPFLVVGAYVIFGRFIIDAWVRSRTFYAVTNRRVIVRRRIISESIKSVDLDTLSALDLSERGDRTGTIRLAPSGGMFALGNGLGIWSPALDPTPQLFRICDARSVYELIRSLRTATTGVS